MKKTSRKYNIIVTSQKVLIYAYENLKGVVAKMKKIWGRKVLGFAVGVCLLLTMICQNVAFVSAEPEEKTVVVNFEESLNETMSKTIEILNLFDISEIVVDSGKVSYSREGDKVTVTVSEGVYRVGPHTQNVTLTIEDDKGIFDEKTSYNVDGYEGILTKIDSGYDEAKGLYWVKYQGSVTKENCKFYQYTVTIKYTENVRPEVYLTEPKRGMITNGKINVQGYVRDENIGDELKLFFSFDSYDESMTGNLLNENSIISDGTWQEISGTIDLSPFNLKDGDHDFYFWAVDKRGVRSVGEIIRFTLDTVPPEAPVLTPDKTESTNQSVVVSVYYPPDAVGREIKINDGPWMPITDITKNDQIIMDENGKIEARAIDEAGNISEVAELEIKNIDKIPPTAPTINTSADETTEQPIKAMIVPGVDNESGVDRTEYCLRGASTKDWEKYDEGTEITITALGETEICARTIDNAGNISAETVKKVTIKKKEDSGGNNGGSGGTGGNSGNNGGSGGTGGSGSSGGSGSNSGGGNNDGNGNDGKKDDEILQPEPNIPGAGGSPVDLSVFISADKSKYEEGEVITFNITYKNKTNVQANNVIVKAGIPANTTVEDIAGGTQNGNDIEWKIESLKANSSGKIQYKVKVNLLEVPEISSSATASITASGTLINKDDDESRTIFLLYSNRFGENFHGKYITGYEDNTFRPLNNITRAEVATIMANILGLKQEVAGGKTYTDLSKSHWAYNNIIAVTEKGLFTGYEDGSFRPDNFITRAEFATVLANYLGLKNVEHDELNFADIENHWAKNFIEEIYRVRLIEGYLENGLRLFKPDNYITRSEAVTIINKMLFRGPLEGAKVPFTDVEEGYWAYGHILESSIDHYYVRNKDQSETIVNKKQ